MGKIKAFLGLMKKNKLLTFLICNLGVLIPAITLSTVAWFSNQSQIQPSVRSSVVTSYFESGTGTSTDPYVIYRPVQYFNLVNLYNSDSDWFDKSGYFKFGDDKDGDGNIEFASYTNEGVEVDTNIETPKLNMAYYDGSSDRRTIVPLGNESNPFTGHIIGDGLTVEHLTIKGAGLSDIGIFGYVESSARIDNIYFNDVRINITNPDITHAHDNHSDNARIGHIAGHTVDAKTSFTDVYVNNCEIYNTSASVLKRSDFGDFGKNDAVSTETAAGTDDSYKLNPSGIHDMLNDEYNTISGNSLIARNTEYDDDLSSETIATAISSSGDSYSMNSTSSRNYSLSTVGYETSDIYKNLRYVNGTNAAGNPNYYRVASTTKETTIAPSNQDTAGEYIYWDSTNNKWVYYVSSTTSEETTTVNFNCFAMRYTFNSTTYWLKYDTGSLTWVTDSPTWTDTSDLANYLWVFRESETSNGVSSFSSNDETRQVKIYSPNNKVYMKINGSYNPVGFTASYQDAALWSITGSSTAINSVNQVNNNPCALTITGTQSNQLSEDVITSKPVSFRYAIIFTLDGNDITSRPSQDSAPYRLVTDLSTLKNNDVVTFGCSVTSGTTTTNYLVSATQNSNNRAVVQDVTINYDSSIGTYVIDESTAGGFGSFTLGITSDGYYTFFDSSLNGYLYCNGKTTTSSGKTKYTNSLKTNLTTIDNTAKWDITLGTDGSATTFQSQTTYVNNEMYFNFNTSTNKILCTYYTGNITTKYYRPSIYLKDESLVGTITTSNAFQFSAESTTGNVQTSQYDTYIADLNSSDYTQFTTPRSETTTINFNFQTSRVSIKQTYPDTWKLVTNASDLSVGTTIAIASLNSNYAMSTVQNDTTRGQIEITKDSENSTMSFDDGAALAQFELKAGSSSGSYSLFDTSSEGYLEASGGATSGNNYLTTSYSTVSSTSSWTISISSNAATIQCLDTSTSSRIISYYSSSSVFNAYTSVSTANSVCIYKLIPGKPIQTGQFYISDDIEGGYDPNQIDVVGSATFNTNSVTLSGDKSDSLSVDYYIEGGETAVGNKFYNTQFCESSIVMYIPNTGSLDLGTITLQYTATGSSEIEFIKGIMLDDSFSACTMSDLSCENDGDTTTYSYELSINMYNIYQMCFCGLDSSGNIAAVFGNGTSTPTYGTASNVATWVLMLSNSGTGSISITQLDYSFTSMIGNTGDNGTSGYMEASYDENGALQGSNNTLEGTVLNFYYDVSDGAIVDVTVNFNKTTMTYTVTFTSSVAMDVNFFNYDAENYNLMVNGQPYTRGSQTISISATS